MLGTTLTPVNPDGGLCAPAAQQSGSRQLALPLFPTGGGDSAMNTVNSTPSWYSGFKAVIFALLACDAAVYAMDDTASRALDTFAWLILLVLFEWETEFGGPQRARSATAAIHLVRIAAIVAIGAATAAYLYEMAWLDVINSGLWIAVIAMLEYEVRFPRTVAPRARAFLAAATGLYAGLAILVVIWAWRGEWFDAYDALLWIIAFVTIEMDVLRFSRRSVTTG